MISNHKQYNLLAKKRKMLCYGLFCQFFRFCWFSLVGQLAMSCCGNNNFTTVPASTPSMWSSSFPSNFTADTGDSVKQPSFLRSSNQGCRSSPFQGSKTFSMQEYKNQSQSRGIKAPTVKAVEWFLVFNCLTTELFLQHQKTVKTGWVMLEHRWVWCSIHQKKAQWEDGTVKGDLRAAFHRSLKGCIRECA